MPLAPLIVCAKGQRRQHRVSGQHALYRPGSSSLGGAGLRAHVTLRPSTDCRAESDDESGHRRRGNIEVDPETMFPVVISIERAFHLPIVTEEGEARPPSAYVSYQTADYAGLSCTPVVPATANPVFSHEHSTYLDRSLLAGGSALVLKAWHKVNAGLASQPDKVADKVLGFVSVDLTPLTTGFLQLCGWYNIIDFQGLCQGQIKISITPQESLLNTGQKVSSHWSIQGRRSVLSLVNTGQKVSGHWSIQDRKCVQSLVD